MPLPALVLHTHAVMIDRSDLRADVQVGVLGPGIAQQREQRAALHAQAHQARIQVAVAHVHHRTPAGRLAIQPPHRCTVLQGLLQQPHLPQHLQPARLQQKSRTNRPGRGRTLEHVQPMPIGTEQHGQCLPRRTVSHYRNSQCLLHRPCSVCVLTGPTWTGAKKPAEAGFFNRTIE